MRALVTGASGFVGSHLVDALLQAGWSVTTLDTARRPATPGVVRVIGDLSDPPPIAKQDVVFHLAAISQPGACEQDPERAFRVNALGAVRLARAVGPCRFLHVSSGDVYGRARRIPTPESEPPRPANAYGASKTCAESLILAERPDAVILRPFNHTGPGQSPRFVAPAFAAQIAAAEARRRPPVLRVGDLSPVRDFLDVRDVVRAYVLAAERAAPGIYNIASGRGVAIGDLLDMLIGLARIPLRVVTDPALRRPGEPDRRIGDAARFRRATGWAPTIPLRRTLADLLEAERSSIS